MTHTILNGTGSGSDPSVTMHMVGRKKVNSGKISDYDLRYYIRFMFWYPHNQHMFFPELAGTN